MRVYKPPNEYAMDLYEAMTGAAARVVEYMPLEEIDHREGVANIVKHLSGAFVDSDLENKGVILSQYEQIRRSRGENLRDFVNRYIQAERRLLDVGIDIRTTCDAEARGHRLLTKALLPSDGWRNVLTHAGHQYDFDRLRNAMILLYPNNKPSPGVYDQTSGREFGTAPWTPRAPSTKGGGRGASGTSGSSASGGGGSGGRWQLRRVNLTGHDTNINDGGGEAPPDGSEPAAEEVPPSEAGGSEENEAPQEDEPGEDDQDIVDAMEETIGTINEVLSVSSQKLKHIVQGRKFTQKRGYKPGMSIAERKAGSSCAICGERGHWKGDPECKGPKPGGTTSAPPSSAMRQPAKPPNARTVRIVEHDSGPPSGAPATGCMPMPHSAHAVAHTVSLHNPQQGELDDQAVRERSRRGVLFPHLHG